MVIIIRAFESLANVDMRSSPLNLLCAAVHAARTAK